jgi:hypothetical protein
MILYSEWKAHLNLIEWGYRLEWKLHYWMNAHCTVLVVRIIVEVTWGLWQQSCMSPEVFYVWNFPTFSTVQHPECTGAQGFSLTLCMLTEVVIHCSRLSFINFYKLKIFCTAYMVTWICCGHIGISYARLGGSLLIATKVTVFTMHSRTNEISHSFYCLIIFSHVDM